MCWLTVLVLSVLYCLSENFLVLSLQIIYGTYECWVMWCVHCSSSTWASCHGTTQARSSLRWSADALLGHDRNADYRVPPFPFQTDLQWVLLRFRSNTFATTYSAHWSLCLSIGFEFSFVTASVISDVYSEEHVVNEHLLAVAEMNECLLVIYSAMHTTRHCAVLNTIYMSSEEFVSPDRRWVAVACMCVCVCLLALNWAVSCHILDVQPLWVIQHLVNLIRSPSNLLPLEELLHPRMHNSCIAFWQGFIPDLIGE